LAFTPDGLRLATGSAGVGAHRGSYQIWDLKNFTPSSLPAERHAVTALAYRPDGKLLALAYRGDRGKWIVELIRVAEGRVLRRYVAHRKGIAAIAFTPDSRWLVSAGADGVIRSWH
jgi:WD40 repeat protein